MVNRRRLVVALLLAATLPSCDRGEPAPREREAPKPVAAAAEPADPVIAPSAEPAPAPTRPDVASLLGLADPTAAEEVGKLLEAGAKSLAGQPIPDPDAVQHFLERSMSEGRDGVRFEKSADEITHGVGQLVEARERWGSEAEAILRAAAAQVQRARWGYTTYAAKADVLRALVTLYPGDATNRFRFHADPGVARPASPQPCPAADPRWKVAKPARYFDEPAFTKLTALPDTQLPGGAIQEAVSLLGIPVAMNEFSQGGSGQIPPLATDLVVRYGERALGCLFDALLDPVATARTAGGTVGSLRYGASRVAAKLPTGASVKLFRAAFLAGWTDWSRELPQTPEHQELARELGEGPYLAASRNPYRAPQS